MRFYQLSFVIDIKTKEIYKHYEMLVEVKQTN